ncbi:class I SAM-dependent methyltransferase [Salinimicrobium catena]|uniref:class I SAM-dependent methyltransferase n=1 Tax=Salinimicrobium catena TaxID=390640 RepID=UPI002FE4F7FA
MDYQNKSERYYSKVRQEMKKYLPENAERIIDVGCGNGSFASGIRKESGAEVWGVEYTKEGAQEAEKVLDKVFSGSCEENLKSLPDHYFDVAFFNDVLEHMPDPAKLLSEFKLKMAPGGIVISSIPNIRYHNALLPILFKKDFRYKSSGVMDYTHLRFFTSKSITRLFEEQGYEVIVHEGINRSKSLKPVLYNIPLLFTQMDIFYPQFATVAKVVK